MHHSRPVLAAAAAVVTVAALAGCTAGGTGASSGYAGGSYSSTDKAAPAAAAAGVEFQAGSGRMPTTSGHQVVTTGSLNLVTDHPIAVASRIEAIVEGASGSIADSTQDPTGRASANLTLRIPSAAFQTTLDAIEHQHGVDVRNVNVKTDDVTSTVTDYALRIQNLRTSITRLQQLLAKATSSSALVQIESSLTDRQGQLEQLLGQQKTLTDQVAYSTLAVSVVTPAAAPAQGPNDFLAGLATGWQALVATLAAIAVASGVALPWIVLIGALFGIAVAVTRAVKRRARTA